MTLPNSALEKQFRSIAGQIRSRELDIGRHTYALCMTHSVYQAMLCGYQEITVIELGVASGHGLRELCCAADYFESKFDIKINVYGFDTGTGLPAPQGHKDHPEIWQPGEFAGDQINLPARAQLVLGNVADTIPEFIKTFSGHLGFVAIDLDYYSSTVAAMPLFTMAPDHYLPAMPVYVDDVNVCITYNPWCGEAAAIEEFNQANRFRKFEQKPSVWNISNFYVLHVLDHPYRTGQIVPPYSINIDPI